MYIVQQKLHKEKPVLEYSVMLVEQENLPILIFQQQCHIVIYLLKA